MSFNSDKNNDLELKLITAFEELRITPTDRKRIREFLDALQEKDRATYEHCLRVGLSAKRIAQFLKLDAQSLLLAGLLHDLGKINVPLATLQKKEVFDAQDYMIVQRHVLDGYDLLKDKFPLTAAIIVQHHSFQENNYPHQMPEQNHNYSNATRKTIDKAARIIALADCYDALHRNNGKFVQNRPLTPIEIKEKMLELNQDQMPLIEELYQASIFLTY